MSIVIVTVNGQDWEVTTFTGSYDDNISKFELFADNGGLGAMPWWSNQIAAIAFMAAVGAGPGMFLENSAFLEKPDGVLLNYTVGLESLSEYSSGPFFGLLKERAGSPGQTVNFVALLAAPSMLFPSGLVEREAFGEAPTDASYALAQAVALGPTSHTPVPTSLHLGFSAAFGFSRKLRKRVKFSTAASASNLPLA